MVHLYKQSFFRILISNSLSFFSSHGLARLFCIFSRSIRGTSEPDSIYPRSLHLYGLYGMIFLMSDKVGLLVEDAATLTAPIGLNSCMNWLMPH